ncbi:hypothetical protein RRG08_052570 [Elysia crispata]|uniref:Galactose-3-O-sulfotransferase 3 n=1 Tax=Elysia crispata TaxID=231223 RepID=A0AAE1A121_9GAST|nr:hypothetical protein RRG08_052570 [Elysia crispata]
MELRGKLFPKRRCLVTAVVTLALLLGLYISYPHEERAEKILQCYDSPLHRSDPHNPTEVQQVVFVKVHKAASSTVQNILFRFALSRNLTSLLPVTGTLISEREAAIPRENVIPHPRGEGTFDVLGVHVVYDHKEMDKYFPKSAFRVAIIRDPLKQAVSALAYYTVVWPYPQLTSGFNRHPLDPITSFLKHPEDFSGGPGCPELGSWVSNRMSYDLGVGSQASSLETLKRDDAAVQLFLQTLEKQFDLILIADHFEESIVLLRRYLKWSMKDIIFIKVNAMQEGEDSVWRKRPNLTAIDLSAFEQCNKLDYRLYQHFLPVFFEKIHKETLFQQEVDAFREIQRKPKPDQTFERATLNEFSTVRIEDVLMSTFICEFEETNQLSQVRHESGCGVQWSIYNHFYLIETLYYVVSLKKPTNSLRYVMNRVVVYNGPFLTIFYPKHSIT